MEEKKILGYHYYLKTAALLCLTIIGLADKSSSQVFHDSISYYALSNQHGYKFPDTDTLYLRKKVDSLYRLTLPVDSNINCSIDLICDQGVPLNGFYEKIQDSSKGEYKIAYYKNGVQIESWYKSEKGSSYHFKNKFINYSVFLEKGNLVYESFYYTKNHKAYFYQVDYKYKKNYDIYKIKKRVKKISNKIINCPPVEIFKNLVK